MTFASDGLDSATKFAAYGYRKGCLTPKDLEGNEGPLSLLVVRIADAAAGIVMIIHSS